MQRRNAAIAVVTLTVTAFLAGRGWWKPTEKEDVEPDRDEVLVAESTQTSSAREINPHPISPTSAILRVGDEFPYVRTIEQRITQQSPSGPVTSTSNLELRLGLRVDEIHDQTKRLQVRYSRVRYSQNIAGEQFTFDSEIPTGVAPLAARPYQGLLNNGFDLLLGPDNLPVALEGFDAFLKRCVRDVPPEDRQVFSAALVGMSQDDSISNFIDESIGLLTYITGSGSDGTMTRVGAKWEQQRHIDRPIPLDLINACTLKSIDEHYATIDIVGEIHPALDVNSTVTVGQEKSIVVRGGRAIGQCVIDRRSGMPLESRMERTLEMIVPTRDGRSIEQQKFVQTTIHAMPSEAPSSPALRPEIAADHGAPPPPREAVVPASYERPDVPPAVNP